MTDENDNLMSEFWKLQSETKNIFPQRPSSLDIGSLTGNKLAKDIHDFCEKTIELQDKFEKEIVERIGLISEKQCGQDELIDEIRNLRIEVKDGEDGLRKDYKEVLDELQSIKTLIVENIEESEASDLDVYDDSDSTKENEENGKPNFEKKFSMKATVEDVLSLTDKYQLSEKEEHFGTEWVILFRREAGYLSIFTECTFQTFDKWSIDVDREVKMVSNDGSDYVISAKRTFRSTSNCWGWSNFMKWETIENEYLIDGKINLEVNFTIEKTEGIYKKGSRTFGKEMQGFSDTVLILEDNKFHVFKLLLVAQSTYFKFLLHGFINNSDHIINNVDPEDFHVFLGVLYGETLDKSTVEITLLLAEQFDSKVVTDRCEDFLIKKSKKTLKKKLQLATRYKLEKLKNSCIDSIKSPSEIQSIIPQDLIDMDHVLLASLMKKTLDFLVK